MNVQLNGEPRILAEGTTIGALIEELGLTSRRVAVELNRDVVERAQWPTTIVSENDEIEVVQFVGGG